MSNVILYGRVKFSFENWNLCRNRKRWTTRARPLAPATIIFQRSFTVRECTDRNDRSALRSVSSTFAESLIVTNGSSAMARTVVSRGAKGHTREFIKSRGQMKRCLLSNNAYYRSAWQIIQIFSSTCYGPSTRQSFIFMLLFTHFM